MIWAISASLQPSAYISTRSDRSPAEIASSKKRALRYDPDKSQTCTFRHRSAYVIATKISFPFCSHKPLSPILNDPLRNTASSMRATSFCAFDSLSCLRLVGLVTNRLVRSSLNSIFSALPLCLSRTHLCGYHQQSSPVCVRPTRQ